jgi:hypothetical protein
MPSWRIHNECGRKIGLPEEVVKFIDSHIDTIWGTHDLGLEMPTAPLENPLGIKSDLRVVLDNGINNLFDRLEEEGRLDEVHLDAVALHILLDSIDRRIKSLGTEDAEQKPKEFLYDSIEWIIEKLETQYNRYFLLSDSQGTIKTRINILIKHILSLVKNHERELIECIPSIVKENKEKGRNKVEYGKCTQLLSKLCKKYKVSSCFFSVNGESPLPPASALRRAWSLLEKGETVTIKSIDGKISITASTVEEFVENINKLLESVIQ